MPKFERQKHLTFYGITSIIFITVENAGPKAFTYRHKGLVLDFTGKKSFAVAGALSDGTWAVFIALEQISIIPNFRFYKAGQPYGHCPVGPPRPFRRVKIGT